MAVAAINTASAPRNDAALLQLGRAGAKNSDAKARDVAEGFTTNLFFGPLLEEMRKLPFGRSFGHGGRGEEVFGEQLDNRVADAVAKSDPGGVVTTIANWVAEKSDGNRQKLPAEIGADRANWQAALAARGASLTN